jgi:sugar/nucleoside kinase (ribokinase family)
MQLDLRVGYLGVAGRVPVLGLGSRQVFRELGVDDSVVYYDETRLSGMCLSVVDGDERTLFTHGGANLTMADYIRRNIEGLAGYLSSARIVHLTSFLDPETPAELVRLLTRARELNPDLVITFDPGHVWAADGSPAVAKLIAMSNHLLLNNREFEEVGGSAEGDPDDSVAHQILERFESTDAVVIVKRRDEILNYRRHGGKAVRGSIPHEPLPPDQIQDSTGAGDIFAAGVLAALASERLHLELGSVLGMRLARHKLGFVGSHGHDDFASITRATVGSFDSQRQPRGDADGVFIAHGRSPQWLAVKEFVDVEFGRRAMAFDAGAWSGKSVTEALNRYLDQCGFAVCVLTAEDVTVDRPEWARQNVVHEVGLFQGRYGTKRVVLLVEEGCSFIPLAPPEHIIAFPNGAIESAFWKLRALLRTQLTELAG